MAAPDLNLLRDVSRSFYLSIRALPRPLRHPVALGYLLARLTDTIADTAAAKVELRLRMLDAFASAIQGKEPEVTAAELQASFAAHQQNEAEKKLVASAGTILRQLEESEDRVAIRNLLGTITRGQRLDLTRWSSGTPALASADELRDYTYLVAGCVGEFWTKLCLGKVPDFTPREESEMMELARRYGSGLQLVNILRDAGDDLRAGRCYFPEDEMRGVGIAAADLADAPEQFLPIYRRWLSEARDGLDAGLQYCIAIEPPRVRIATALPALIGIRTLALLEQAGLLALREKVKVPRSEVRKITASATITLANRSRLRSARARL